MTDPLTKTPEELWAHLEAQALYNPLVRAVLLARQAHGLTREHASSALVVALLEQNKALEANVLKTYQDAPLGQFMAAPTSWQERLVQERDQLQERLQKLQAFKHTETWAALPSIEISVLLDQEEAMVNYLDALETRLSRPWDPPTSRG